MIAGRQVLEGDHVMAVIFVPTSERLLSIQHVGLLIDPRTMGPAAHQVLF